MKFKMFKTLFQKSDVVRHANTETGSPVCRITVYNKALKACIAQYNIPHSERHLIGALRVQYPTHTYRVETVNY